LSGGPRKSGVDDEKLCMDETIRVKLNGKDEGLIAGTTVARLLAQRSVRPETVVVEVNLDIVPKEAHESKRLQTGDTVEILHFVGGG
jgi:thiamine biosynthesis protein ThiS